ncbi:MAG: glutamyl-tRNA reductase [Candidatus Sumerlaeia bacterium]|nr:glutamyl-tRNA reductase [Candidatus Sumerlaeia bacterium]
MELLFIGLNHRTAPIELRDRLAIVPTRLQAALADAAGRTGLLEVVLLSTCNRSEVWTVAEDPRVGSEAILAFLCEFHGVAAGEIQPHLYTHTDRAAVRHIFRVVAGLDSMVLGEPQVAGQVKEAFEAARAAGATGFLLERLFQHALHTNKRIRSETRLGEGAVSVSYVAVELARKIFGDLAEKRVLVLGAGDMGEQALECLEGAGAGTIQVINRTHQKAVEMAARHNWQALPWESLAEALVEADIVISSTGAPHPVVRTELMREVMARRRNAEIVLIDIATPRDVENAVGNLYNVFLYNLDDLNGIAEENRRRRRAEAEAAERIVEAETDAFLHWLASLEIKETLVELRKSFDAIRLQELEWLRSKMPEMSEHHAALVEQFSNRLINKLLHGPMSALRRGVAGSQAAGLAEAVRRLFGLTK